MQCHHSLRQQAISHAAVLQPFAVNALRVERSIGEELQHERKVKKMCAAESEKWKGKKKPPRCYRPLIGTDAANRQVRCHATDYKTAASAACSFVLFCNRGLRLAPLTLPPTTVVCYVLPRDHPYYPVLDGR